MKVDPFIIRLWLSGCVVRYAQNRSETFDYTRSVCQLTDAKRFATRRHARLWLKRNGFTKTYSVAPFIAYGICTYRAESRRVASDRRKAAV